MRTRLRWRAISAAAAAVGAALALTGGAGAHRSGCHSHHTCPSDHHTYVWFDASGKGWSCAEPGAPELDPALDTHRVVYDGLVYFCRAAGTGSAPSSPAAPAVGATVLLRPRTASSGCRLGAFPDRRCSPGAYSSGLTRAVICSPGFRTSTIRNVPESVKHAVEAEYGLVPRPYGRTLEIDHIVSLELGGSNAIANLFPERAPGYHAKDRLENKLHDLVCAGRLSLRSAQRQIAANWQALYRRVFGAGA
jgi:hypothetical protein